MSDLPASPKEATGPLYSVQAMRHAQAQSWRAVDAMAQGIAPGMDEAAAQDLAARVLADMGMDRLWHPSLIRFGENTLETFKSHAHSNRTLHDNDIYFIDIGPVWNGHEGDVGATFAVGNDAEMHAAAAHVKQIWHEVRNAWRTQRLSGQALYALAGERAQALGWHLHPAIRGHRVSDYPHAPYRGGSLGDFNAYPQPGRWILEIQLAHPLRPFGAFYEDLLLDDAEAA